MRGMWFILALLAMPSALKNADDLAEHSSFVFRGTIVKSGASTMPEVAASKDTAVVLVEEVYHAAATMPHVSGKEITLNLARDAEAGSSYIFFTNVWLYGKGLAARESGRLDARGDRESERKLVEQAFLDKEDRALEGRIARAALVVAGRVLRTEPMKRDPRWPESEHDPQWWTAVVQVEAFAKGQAPRELPVVFPASTDELWIEAPKFKAGQEGVWILQKNTREKVPPVYAVSGYTALDPRDFQPKEAWEKVRRLAATPQAVH